MRLSIQCLALPSCSARSSCNVCCSLHCLSTGCNGVQYRRASLTVTSSSCVILRPSFLLGLFFIQTSFSTSRPHDTVIPASNFFVSLAIIEATFHSGHGQQHPFFQKVFLNFG